jgi:transposase, IS5 family
MERVVPWKVLVQIVEPRCPRGRTGHPPFGVETMLRIHHLQQWFCLSDPAMEAAPHDVSLYRAFAKLDGDTVRPPGETAILRFRHLLEKHDPAPDMLRAVNDLLQQSATSSRRRWRGGQKEAPSVASSHRCMVKQRTGNGRMFEST